MIEFGLFVLALFSTYFALLFTLPLRWVKAMPADQLPQKLPKLYVYSYQVHIHTQFSHDSLGKPEDIKLKPNLSALVSSSAELTGFGEIKKFLIK